MYIPIVVIICMVCGAIGGTLGYYLTKKKKKRKRQSSDRLFIYIISFPKLLNLALCMHE